MELWLRSILANKRVRNPFEPPGTYQGRHIITRDSPIDGGVSLGGAQREAIVVDSEKYPLLKELYKIVISQSSSGNYIHRDRILPSMFKISRDCFYNNPHATEEDVERMIENECLDRDVKIPLDFFIYKGLGVCRHMALTAGVLIEMSIKRNLLRGKVSIDRNETERGGHEWARYIASTREVVIIDPAQNYLDALHNPDKVAPWNYFRPTDRR